MTPQALVIGGGPGGLMAAEVLAAGGAQVVIAEAMPTPARKFLMAGKSGLNLTRDESFAQFAAQISLGGVTDAYSGKAEAILSEFGPPEVQNWARGLGVDLFTGSTGRVFPVGMKGSPLLRAWLLRLRKGGVEMRTRWRWTGFEGEGFTFDTPDGRQVLRPVVCVLALGGASWPRLGSDGAWAAPLAARGVPITRFRPANMGFEVDWSPPMGRHFGAAVKGVAIHADGEVSRGEWVITRKGIEGGGIYALAARMRDGTAAVMDLAPDTATDALTEKFSSLRGKLSVGNGLRRVLGDPVRAALMLEWGRPLPADPAALAALAKALPLRHRGPAGLARAISSAGGIRWDGLSESLEITAIPGCFAAGEMLDWEAPTGGYLLTFSMASGRAAGRGAFARLQG